MPQLSIIVPVYNVEKYLEQCVESVLASTFTDYELILVDDGSVDRSGLLCDDLAATDHRIRVIHQTNSGVSRARNNGIEQARGWWITFIDSDDFIGNGFLAGMMQHAAEDVDFVHVGCTKYMQSNRQCIIEQRYDELKSNDPMRLFAQFRGLVVSKLFRRDLLNRYSIRFDERMKVAEDLAFTCDYCRYVKTYCFANEVGYFYRVHSQSTTKSIKRKFDDMAAEYHHLYRSEMAYCSTKGVELPQMRRSQLGSILLNDMIWMYYQPTARDLRLRRLRTEFSAAEREMLRYVQPHGLKRILRWMLVHERFRCFDALACALIGIKTKLNDETNLQR